MEKLRIVFMGTPDFAVASLKTLIDSGENIVGVITSPDKPQGRGKQTGVSAVKSYALDQNLHILQPLNLKEAEFINELRSLKADLQVVVAFRMLPEVVWAMPPKGTINLHGSLLPQYRGAAPIQWAVMNGETVTGVTTFLLQHKIDTGNIIFQEKEPIDMGETMGEVYERLMYRGAGLVLKTVRAIAQNDYKPKPQVESKLIKHAPKLNKENTFINWNRPAMELYHFIRGLNPYPASWTMLHQKNLKVFFVEITNRNDLKPGVFESNGKDEIYVGTQDFAVKLMDIQLEGKKRMKTPEFLKGYRWPK